ncbi:MAG: PQQ-binding-like beta-propeller repeat protein [Pikeienuella sp.]
MSTGFGHIRALRSVMVPLACVVGLSACGLFDDDEQLLAGDRIPVRLTTDDVLTRPEIRAQIEPLTAPISNSEWTQTNGSSLHVMGHLAGPSSLSVAWTSSFGDGGGGRGLLTSPPIVVGGSVFMLDAAAKVTAFDASSGARKWQADLSPEGEDGEDGFGGGLAFSNGKLLATTGFGEALALNPNSGEIEWRLRLTAPARAAPAATKGMMVAVSRDNTAFGVSIADGALLWRVAGASSEAGVLGGASPAISANGVAILPFGSGELVAVNTANGRRIWSDVLSGGRRGLARSTISDISSDPVVMGVAVIAGNQSGRLAAFDGRSGRRGWTRDFGASSPVWGEGQTIFVITDDAKLMRLSGQDGSTMWSTPLRAFRDEDDREDPIGYGGPVLVGGHLVVTSSLGQVLTFDPITGEADQTISVSGAAALGPVVANGTVYVVTEGGSLVALR